MFCQKEREIMLGTCLLVQGKYTYKHTHTYTHEKDKLKANESGYLCQVGQQRKEWMEEF